MIDFVDKQVRASDDTEFCCSSRPDNIGGGAGNSVAVTVDDVSGNAETFVALTSDSAIGCSALCVTDLHGNAMEFSGSDEAFTEADLIDLCKSLGINFEINTDTSSTLENPIEGSSFVYPALPNVEFSVSVANTAENSSLQAQGVRKLPRGCHPELWGKMSASSGKLVDCPTQMSWDKSMHVGHLNQIRAWGNSAKTNVVCCGLKKPDFNCLRHTGLLGISDSVTSL